MALFAVSDLHIWGADDPLYSSLIAILKERAAPGDTVVLAGDLFDLFVGNKDVFKSRFAEFIAAVRDAGGRGVLIHYIEGNHDFLIRSVFKGVPGLSVHSHDVSVKIGDKRFFFAHGDTVDPTDYAYRILRFLFRSPLMRALVAVLPGKLLDWIGKKSSHASQKKAPRLPVDLPVRKMEFLRKTYRSFAADRLAEGNDFVVMGHCHDLDEMSFQIGGRTGQYVNVGYPRVHGSFLSWSPGEPRIQREKLPSQSG